MGKNWPALLVLLFFLLCGCIGPVEEGTVQKFEQIFLVKEVIDGDTIMLAGGEKVRLIGIDTPERGEACYNEAKEKLAEMILEKEVSLEQDVESFDKYGRSLYYVYAGGSFVNLEMVRQGYAHSFEYAPNTMHSTQFRQAEALARADNSGCLWQ